MVGLPLRRSTFLLAGLAFLFGTPASAEPQLVGEVWANNFGDPNLGTEHSGLSLTLKLAKLRVEASADNAWSGRDRELYGSALFFATRRWRLSTSAEVDRIEFNDLRGKTTYLVAGIEFHPVETRSRGEVLVLRLNSAAANVASDELLFLDQRVTMAEAAYVRRRKTRSTSSRLYVSVAASIPGETKFRTDARLRRGLPTFPDRLSLARVGYTQALSLGAKREIVGSVSGQYAMTELPNVKRFAYGGPGRGGAFRPSSLVGDNGVVLGLELRQLIVGPAGLEGRVYTRFDAGWASSREEPFAPPSDRAASFGVGVQVRVRRVRAQLEYNTAVVNPRRSPRQANRLLFEVVYQPIG